MDSVRPSYWCYGCSRYIRVGVRPQDAVSCPDCGGGFVEEMQTPSGSPVHRFPAAATYRRSSRERSPFNPVIVLRDVVGGDFELYYDDGAGSGLRPLPASMSEFLMGSGFDRLLDQLLQLEISGPDHPPASKAAIESMPVVTIGTGHVSTESHCAVCKEPFRLHSEARQMPCRHIYHADCILPWLSLRNSCPVCRHQLPALPPHSAQDQGLTIWRLPGGGFAVGRFTGGRRAAADPVVFTEMDGGFNTSAAVPATRISVGGRAEERGGVGRAFRRFASFFGRLRVSASQSRSTRRSLFRGGSSRRPESRHWTLDSN